MQPPRRDGFGGGRRGGFSRGREGGFAGGGRGFGGPSGPPAIDYRGLVEFIARAVAEHPDEVRVEAQDRPGGAIALKVKMAEADTGRLIGRAGRNIEAIRNLVRVAALKERRRVFVDLA